MTQDDIGIRIQALREQAQADAALLDNVISEFDIRKYETAAKLTVFGWLACLDVRAQLLEVPSDELRNKIKELFHDPIHWSLRVFDRKRTSAPLAPPHIEDGKPAHVFHSLLQTRITITVDLARPRDELIKQFGLWIREARKEHRIKPVNRPFERDDFIRWDDMRVLAYLDFKILERIRGTAFTYEWLGETLFPNEEKVDVRDRVGRSVIPLACLIIQPACRETLRLMCKK